ncbi:IS1249 family transposase [Luteococcus sp. OSA5]|uniref:IS1249 family transposase n=1 Tax=Luteococcus sp. OSA5 TaxID=3401630 RepID=UPI003B429497
MQVARNHPRCGVCGAKLVKNGRTTAGRTRWRCKTCGASTTRTRGDITRRAELGAFQAWLLGPTSQAATGGTGRSFRASTSWCWNIPAPQPVVTGEVDEVLMLDGTYLQDWCVIIAFNGTHVQGWQWCNQESKAAYQALLTRLPAPDMAVVDGGQGVAAALHECWPDTLVQRCYFHIFQTVTRHLTMNPRLEAGKQLRALTVALMRVTSLDAATEWTRQYLAWEAEWDAFLKHRTYAGKHRERPVGIGECVQWWFTHRDLRRCRALFRSLIRREQLFTWLAFDPPRPRTTSPLEGGPNKAIKDLLRVHRGLPPDHARRAVDWLLNSLTEHPHDPWQLARPEHWNPPVRTRQTTEEPLGPQPGTSFSWEDGNGLQKGWAGRSHR